MQKAKMSCKQENLIYGKICCEPAWQHRQQKGNCDQVATDTFYSHQEIRPPEPLNLTLKKWKNAPDSENEFSQQKSDLRTDIQPTNTALSQKHTKMRNSSLQAQQLLVLLLMPRQPNDPFWVSAPLQTQTDQNPSAVLFTLISEAAIS